MLRSGPLRIGQLESSPPEVWAAGEAGRGWRRAASPGVLLAFLEAAAALSHRARALAEAIQKDQGLLAGQRGVLRSLARLGPQTVPQMARARPVSRQHIRALVNPLAERGYVEFIANPAHKRSRLVRLTAKGEELARKIEWREARLLEALAVEVSNHDLRAATGVLDTVREALAGARWREVVESELSR